jgi:molecular chaperone Hsp33
MTQNYLVRATALDGRVRAFALHATGVVSEMRARHATSDVMTAALGRTAMGALLIAAASLKEEDQVLTVEVRGNGPAGRILCTANGRGEVRGMAANPAADAPDLRPGKMHVAGVVGTEGYLSVTKDLGMKESYSGTVELLSGEIGEDLAYYLTKSEQTPSGVGVGVHVARDGAVVAAGGYLVQLLPGLGDDEITAIEERMAALPSPTELIRAGSGPEDILQRIFGDAWELGDRTAVAFRCPCSRERFEAAIVSLGEAEIERIIAEEEHDRTEVVCHFCNEHYYFTADEMGGILRAAR